MEHESERKVSSDIACKIAASSQNTFAGGSSGECQTVARVSLGPEVVAILLKALSGSTCGNPEIFGDDVLP